ncbi:limkain b1, putative, partial [Ixodes scapularis]
MSEDLDEGGDSVYACAEPLADPEEFEDLTDEVSKDSVVGMATQQPAGIGYISVYWDIENCAVPHGVSAYDIVKKVRNEFYPGHREVEFSVACDIGQMKKEVVDELNDAQVTVVHVSSDKKNSADEKLRVKLRRFSDAYKLLGSKIVLITGDVDFTSEVHEMRYHHLIHVVLIHNDQARKSLVECANESIRYSSFVQSLKPKAKAKTVPPQAKAKAAITGVPHQPTSEGGRKDSSVKHVPDLKKETKQTISDIPVQAGKGAVAQETKKVLPPEASEVSYRTK